MSSTADGVKIMGDRRQKRNIISCFLINEIEQNYVFMGR